MLLKTGKWFHGKESKRHNPAKEIEYHLLATPPATPKSIKASTSPKIVKTGFPASSVTKAQLEEQAEEKKRKKLSTSSQTAASVVAYSNDFDSDSSSITSRKSSGGSQKKHVTFDSIEYSSMNNAHSEINNNNNNSTASKSTIESSESTSPLNYSKYDLKVVLQFLFMFYVGFIWNKQTFLKIFVKLFLSIALLPSKGEKILRTHFHRNLFTQKCLPFIRLI